MLGRLRFDQRRGCLFDLLQQIGLADRACQYRNDVNMIGDSPDTVGLAPAIATHRREVCVHAWSNGRVQQWIAVFCAKDDVNEYLAEGLWHGAWREITRQAFSLQY